VQDTGTYWVIMQNEKCCFSVDTVVVLLFDVFVPNAFRPGGANPLFRAIPTGGVDVNNFEFYIFDRWGQNVFKSQDISQGWDGNIDGKEAPGDVYVWIMNYIVENDGNEQKVTYKGSVVLLR
jgi:gliding motility-associated-like protein